MNKANTSQMARDIRAQLVCPITDILAAALSDRKLRDDDLKDMGSLVELIGTILPDTRDVEFFRGMYDYRCRRFQDARAIFAQLDSPSDPHLPARGMLLRCLFALGESTWRHMAKSEVERDPTSDASLLIEAHLAIDDLNQALDDMKPGDPFPEPESSRRIRLRLAAQQW